MEVLLKQNISQKIWEKHDGLVDIPIRTIG